MSKIRTLQANCNGRAATVEVVGSGPDVLIIGSAVPLAWSRPAALALASHGFRVINFDYSTSDGEVEAPEPRTCLQQVDDVIAVLAQVGTNSVSAVGLSRGAITAYGLAARHPDFVSKLVLAFPVAGFADTILDEFPLSNDEQASPEQMLDDALDTAFSADFLSSHRTEARDLFSTRPGSVVRVERKDEEVLGDDEAVTAPTLIISGGKDRVVTPAHPARLHRAIPHAGSYEFPDASHGFIMENPEAFARVVAGFLS